jgi:DNA helicase-2/ATP-dependent DNA helicase PcrA
VAPAPALEGEAKSAVEHRGSPVQIIASAGSGKTEVVSQRVARLLDEGVEPGGIVAFTFTEKAAEELKARIQRRVAEFCGEEAVGPLTQLYVGTIHAFCFRLLQQYVPRYEAYDVLEDNQLAGFLVREGRSIEVKSLDADEKLFRSIHTFIANADVVENELISLEDLEEPFADVYAGYLDRLEAFRALTFGQLIRRAVLELEKPEIFDEVHSPLKHLIVDEYQDVNPAQERLIELLAADPVELSVVGDDDQSIYQWRGTDVRNIVTFEDRYPKTESFTIGDNRRSRPSIVALANSSSSHVEGRLDKEMQPKREAAGAEVAYFKTESESGQAQTIVGHIQGLVEAGYRYRDLAVLLRSRASLGAILDALDTSGIPVQPGGRTNLFLQSDADLFGRLCAWLAGHNWRPDPYGPGEDVTLTDLVSAYERSFGLNRDRKRDVQAYLERWKTEVDDPTGRANLVLEYYTLLQALGVEDWDFDDPAITTRLGVLARCSQILADYESVKRRARIDPDNPGELIGGQDRGEWHYRWLAIFVQNYAQGAYEDFDGGDLLELDAVEVTTVHQAKGLEWPIVFVPSLVDKRFPSSRMGQARAPWYVPDTLFDEGRYNGTENDERRLFYVALTRARDQLCLSYFDEYDSGTACTPSRFLGELTIGDPLDNPKSLPDPAPPEPAGEEEPLVEVTLSDLILYGGCGLSYKLRTAVGFQPTLAPELGYGRAVHHMLRQVAEHVRAYKEPPTDEELDQLFDDEFFLPAANKAAHRELKKSARALVDRYLTDWGEDLQRVWATERPFELRLPDALISGRADVILDDSGGGDPILSIVDYKTAAGEEDEFDFQLQVYTDAGRVEGLEVDSAWVHDLRRADRQPVDVSAKAVAATRERVKELIAAMKEGDFTAKPGPICSYCDVRPICRFRA